MEPSRLSPIFPDRIASALRAVRSARSLVQAQADSHKYRLLRIVDLRNVPEDDLEDFDCVVSEESACLREAGLEIVPAEDFSSPDVRVADLAKLGRLFEGVEPGAFAASKARMSEVNAALSRVEGYLRRKYNPATLRLSDETRVRAEMAAVGAAVRAFRRAGVDEGLLHFIARYVAFWAVGKSEEFREAVGRRWSIGQLRKERDQEIFSVAAQAAEEAWTQDVKRCELAGAAPHVVAPLRKELKKIRALRRRRAADDAREAG